MCKCTKIHRQARTRGIGIGYFAKDITKVYRRNQDHCNRVEQVSERGSLEDVARVKISLHPYQRVGTVDHTIKNSIRKQESLQGEFCGSRSTQVDRRSLLESPGWIDKLELDDVRHKRVHRLPQVKLHDTINVGSRATRAAAAAVAKELTPAVAPCWRVETN